MLRVAHLLGEDITRVDLAVDVKDSNLLCANAVVDGAVTNVDVAHSL